MRLIEALVGAKISREEIAVERHIFRSALEAMEEKYFKGDDEIRLAARQSLRGKLLHIVKASPQGIDGKTVLDLGCGYEHENYRIHMYEPWICRALHAIGVDIIGVDSCRYVLNEKFKAHCIDLMTDEALSIFPDKSVDIAHASLLFDAPVLTLKYGKGAGMKLKDKLMPQLERVVRPDGVFVYDSVCW